MTLADFPRHSLMFGPSPVHPLDRLSETLGGPRLWLKRDDCTGLATGGNKTRKLEYLVPDALAKGADTLVSIGGVQSNHTRQVAAVAAHLGMKAVLVQEHWVDWPNSVNDRVGNILLSRLMGADVRLSPAGFGIGFKDSWKDAIAEVEASGGTPYAIPAGASDHRLGGLGFANWAHEVKAQEAQLGVFFDTIVVCTVTGSTPRRRSTRRALRSPASRGARPTSSASAATSATTRSRCWRDGPAMSTASRSSPPTRRCSSPGGWRA
jgi:1-aminocyclopropane-1-carboxylate deaminase